MIIKSQNGEYLANIAMINTIGFFENRITAYNGKNATLLGDYVSGERCKEIIAEIAEHYNKCEYAKFMGCDNTSYVSNIYEMPEE